MEELIKSLRYSIIQKNWHAALFIALSLPDICGKIDYPTEYSKNRFIKWFNRFLQDNYIKKIGFEKTEVIFLNATDCYSLRCALLHEGTDNIETQKARKVLERFIFSTTLSHLLKINSKILVLNVNVFCNEVCLAAEKWHKETETKVKLLEIHAKNELKI